MRKSWNNYLQNSLITRRRRILDKESYWEYYARMATERVILGQAGLDHTPSGEAKDGRVVTLLDFIPQKLIMKDSETVLEPKLKGLSALFKRNNDLFDSNSVSIAIGRELNIAGEKYKEERLAGLINDEEGEGEIRVFTTAEGLNKIKHDSRRKISSDFGDAIEQIGDDLWMLTFPDGAYRAKWGGVLVSDAPFESGSDRGLFAVPYDAIVGVMAIEREEEALWLNIDYHLDGTPKSKSERSAAITNAQYATNYSNPAWS